MLARILQYLKRIDPGRCCCGAKHLAKGMKVKHSKLSTTVGAALSLGLLLIAGPQSASAQTTYIDPNFSVCAFGTADVSSCGPTDPQLVTSAGVAIGVIGNAGTGPTNPFLILIAVPDLPNPPYTGVAAPAPVPGAGSGLTIALATTAYYGQTNVPVVGYLGEFTSSSPDLYTFAGLPVGNNSMNFGNLSGNALYATAPTSFSIYEFTVTLDSPPPPGSLGTAPVYQLPFTSLGLGSYVAAWGLETDSGTGTRHVYDSAFTVAGFVNSSSSSSSSSTSSSGLASSSGNIPEPNSGLLALLGVGLLGAGFLRRLHTRRG